MALPKLNAPTYELELPSTGEKIKYRPFLVKEQKNLMLAVESEEDSQIKNAIAELISACTFEKIKPFEIPMFDIEYMFLRLRGKSVGEKVKVNVLCPDDNETRVDVNIDLEKVGVQLEEKHTNEINITDDIKIIMRYPTLNDMDQFKEKQEVEQTFDVMKRCIAEIHDGETIHLRIDISENELDEFVESLTTNSFEQMQEFFKTMPKVLHVATVKNPKTKKKNKVIIEGIQSFFE